MFDTLCTYPLASDLFAQAIHPSEPVIALGLATGHVSLHRLPPSNPSESPNKNGCGTIHTAWRTRRHKGGSCRALTFSPDGRSLFSAGVDGVVKIAETETGWVGGKIAVPMHNGTPDPPTLLSSPNPSSLLLATESGALHVYDLRLASSPNTTTTSSFPLPTNPSTPTATPLPTHTFPSLHADLITSLSPLPNDNQILTTGAATITITDLRHHNIVITSEDQDEELLASTICAGKAVVGSEGGVLRVWDVGAWNDEERLLDLATGAAGGRGGCTLDVLAARPAEDEGGSGMCAGGCDDGVVRFVDVGGKGGKGKGKGMRGVGEARHDEVEAVVGLGWLRDGRLVSGGGAVVKIWEEAAGVRVSYSDDEEEEGENGVGDGVLGSDDDEEDGEGLEMDDSDDEEDEKPKKRGHKKKKKKKKRGKGKKGQVGNGIMAFKGLT